ncbi:MAG: hypothetical protein ABSH02_18410, partial [Candidatus Sulfotelmatobacter sp.]
FRFDFGAERDEPLFVQTDIGESFDSRLLQPGSRVGNEIAGHAIEHALQRLVELQLAGRIGINLNNLAEETFEDGDAFANLVEREQMGFVAVIHIGGAVANFIG